MSIWMRVVCVLLSAGAIVLAFPPFDLWWLALIAWVPFLLAIDGASWRAAGRLGLLHGLLVFGGTLCWLTGLFGIAAAVLWMILALFSMPVAVGGAWVSRSDWPRGLIVIAIAGLFSGIEYFRCEVFTLRFPWITPGTALPPNLMTPVAGVYGVTFLVVVLAASLVWWRKSWFGWLTVFAVALVVVVPPMTSDNGQEKAPISVMAVQCEDGLFSSVKKITQAAEHQVDVILWPEYAMSYDLSKSPSNMATVAELMDDRGASLLVTGARTDLDDGRWHNTALSIGRDGVLGRHFKNRPVHFFNDGEPGDAPAVFETPVGTIASPICFDCDYSSVVRQAVAGGADVLFVPSMDAISWGARQHLQHARLFQHRAAENGRYMVVAATSGMTQCISPTGERIASLPLMDEGVLVGRVSARGDLTLFTRGGWMIGPVMMWGSVVVFVAAAVNAWRRKPEQSTGSDEGSAS